MFSCAGSDDDAGSNTTDPNVTDTAVLADFEDALDVHNAERAAVATSPSLEPLRWSNELASYAQAWVNELARRNCEPEHRPREGEFKQLYGENLAWGTSLSGRDASLLWASEKQDYNAESHACKQGAVCGHYTQMVWRNSKELGCASVECQLGNGRTREIVACNYDPPGNFIGQDPY